MAINDLINEVNSIQTKKQAIKEAITSKGVTSEGKLSKFADEIKKISSSEPYWYMINRIRHENGNEGVCIRTNNFNRTVGRITQLTSQGGGRYQSGAVYNNCDESNFTIITADEKSTAKPCRTITTRKDDNIDFGLSKDNFSIDFNNYNASFKNIASKNFSKDPKQSCLIDNSALLIRCTIPAQGGNLYNQISKVENLLSSSTNAKDYTIKMTGSRGVYDSNVKLIPVDSTTFLKAASYRETTITGSFYEVGSRRSGSFRLVPTYGYNDYQRAFVNTTLDYGHYMFLECSDLNVKIVFVGISEALDKDSNANKVVEVYTYTNKRVYQGIYDDTVTLEDNSGINFYIGETYDLYINFSDNGQKYLLNNLKNDSYASSKDGKTIDTIKSIYNSNFISGKDVLIEFNAKKAPAGITNPSQALNLFKKAQRSGNYISYNSTSNFSNHACPVDTILSKSMSNNSVTGFIRLNDNSSTMFPITLEKATNEIKSNSSINFDQFKNANIIAIAPNGILNKNNRMVVFVNTYENNTNNIECFYIKKGNDYITNDSLSPSVAKTQLYISTDSVSQTYIKNKALTDIWTEINNLPKDTYSTYNN